MRENMNASVSAIYNVFPKERRRRLICEERKAAVPFLSRSHEPKSRGASLSVCMHAEGLAS